MKGWLGVLVLAGLVPLRMAAQDDFQPPKVEVFGGYQFMHANSFDGLGDTANTHGYTGSATFNFSKRLGVAADFSDNYQLGHFSLEAGSALSPAHVHIYTYTFGPVVHLISSKDFSVFAHALFGGAHVRPTGCVIFSGSPDECGSGDASGFAMMVGGGVDHESRKAGSSSVGTGGLGPVAFGVWRTEWGCENRDGDRVPVLGGNIARAGCPLDRRPALLSVRSDMGGLLGL